MQIGIVGAGLMGRLLALELSQHRYKIFLFDQDITGKSSAAFASAGMLSPYSECFTCEKNVCALGLRGIKGWQKLDCQSGFDGFELIGSIVLAQDNDFSEMQLFMQSITRKIPKSNFAYIERSQLQNLEPELEFNAAIYFPEEGVVNARKFFAWSDQILKKNNINWINKKVTEISSNSVRTANDKHYDFDWVIDCRGCGAQDMFFDLRCVRGEATILHAPTVNLTRPIRLLHPRYSIYVVPRSNQHYYVGASEIEADDDSPISVRSALEMLSSAYRVHNDFLEARVVEVITGRRPVLADHLPRICYRKGIIAVNGLYRHGFLFAPVLVETILALLTSGKGDAHDYHFSQWRDDIPGGFNDLTRVDTAKAISRK